MLFGVRVVVVVPAYKEGPRIRDVLRTVPAAVDRIVVVDDASPDNTRSEAERSGDPRVEVLAHEVNRGVGAAIATGYLRALEVLKGKRDAMVVMAGDGQMDPRDLPDLVLPIALGRAEYVKGNRFLWPGVEAAMPPARRHVGQALSRLTAKATGLAISDSQCGYTALARGACARLNLAGLWPRYGYPNDLLGLLALANVRVVEAPVRPIYAGAPSGLRPWHIPVILGLIGRAAARRALARAKGGT